MKKECPFCSIEKVLFENELAFAIPDKYPVRPGHTLVIPRRHVASFFELTDEELLETRTAFLGIYTDARDFFLKNFGKELFLTYGTLLGFVRQGTFIPGDDDFDAGFMADGNNPVSVKSETINMIGKLVNAGFSVSFNRRGRLFRLHERGKGVNGPHLDIHSFWVQDDKVWAHNDFCSSGSREQYVPAVEQDYDLFRAFVPSDPEAFLSAHYGPDWRVPDPAFVNYFLGKDKKVLSNLGAALIAPDEFRECLKDMKGNPGCGEFLSLAGRSLYPLPERDEDFE